MPLNLPVYIAQSTPSAALLSDALPNARLEGLSNLADTLQATLKGIGNYRESLSANQAQKEYQLWLIQEKQDFTQNTDINNVVERSAEFNQKASAKIGEIVSKSGLSLTKQRELSAKMQTQYEPSNLEFSIKVAQSIKTQTAQEHAQQYQNDLGNLMSSVNAANLTPDFLDQLNAQAETQAEEEYAAGLIPKSAVQYLKLQNKMQTTNYFIGRMVKENPSGAYDLVTHNAKNILLEQEALFDELGKSSAYQTMTKADSRYDAYLTEVNALDSTTIQKLGIGDIYVGKGGKELITGSNRYDLGALYEEALAKGISMKEAIESPELLHQFETPYSPTFSRASVYFNDETKDLAGVYKNGTFIPASFVPGTKYYNKSMQYATPSLIQQVQQAYQTYQSANQKEKQSAKQLEYTKELYKLLKKLNADNITGSTPENIVYNSSKQYAGDPYANCVNNNVNWSKEEIIKQIEFAAIEKGVPVAAALALFDRESGFNPNARGGSGEYGLGQLMPQTAKSLGVSNPWNILENINASLDYFSNMYRNNGKNVEYAYAGYNGGAGSVKYIKNGTANKQYKDNVAAYMKLYNKWAKQYGTGSYADL